MILIVPDLAMSVYRSSSSFLFFGLIHGPLLAVSIYHAIPRQEGMSRNRWRKKRRENEPKKERIAWAAPYTEFVKSGTTVLEPPLVFILHKFHLYTLLLHTGSSRLKKQPTFLWSFGLSQFYTALFTAERFWIFLIALQNKNQNSLTHYRYSDAQM